MSPPKTPEAKARAKAKARSASPRRGRATLGDVRTELASMRVSLDRLVATLDGNGRPGLLERVTALEARPRLAIPIPRLDKIPPAGWLAIKASALVAFATVCVIVGVEIPEWAIPGGP